MTRQTMKQRLSRAVQGVIEGFALAALGIAMVTGDIDLVFIEVSQSPIFGSCFLLAGAALSAAQLVTFARLRRR